MKHACKHSQIPKHVTVVRAFLSGFGAEVGQVTRSRCLHVAFSYAGRPFSLPVRPTDSVTDAMRSARKRVCRMLRAAALPLPSAVLSAA